MIISISGLSGSGKNSVGELVAKKLNLRTISFTFKSEAKKKGVSLMDFQKEAGKDKKIDMDFDKEIVKSAKKGKCVVTTWLGPWMVKGADLKVWLRASPEERARRISKRDKMTRKNALEHVKKRDEDNRKRYKKLYDIDIFSHEDFDMILNSENFLPEQLAGIISCAAKEKSKRKS